MPKIKSKNNQANNSAHLVASLFKKLGQEEKIKVQIEPEWQHVGKITRRDGAPTYFRGNNFDLNGLGAAEIAKDKAYAAYFLRQAGYRIIPTKTFYSPDFARALKSQDGPAAAYEYANNAIGFPLIVKPNSASLGQLVCLVYDQREFMLAAKKICEIDRVFLVQPYVTGHDYRVVVLDNEVISAYERLPLAVSGDGISTIDRLLDKKQKKFQKRGRDTVIDKADFRIDLALKRRGFSLASVLARGQTLALLANSNLSTGGEAIDVGEKIDASYKNLAVNIARDLGLRYCGVDLMIGQDIKKPLQAKTNNYYVIEVNAAPGLDHYAQSGARQKRAIKEMYRKILRKLAGKNKTLNASPAVRL